MIKLFAICAALTSLFGDNSMIETMANDPSAVVDGKVNVITGRPCIYEEDLVIQGVEPIRLSRVYIDGEESGYWRIPGDPAYISATEKSFQWIIEEPDECPIVYRKEGHAFSIGKERHIKCIPSNLNSGFSNTSRGKISSRTNLRNQYVLLDEKKIKEEGKPKHVTIHRPDGTVRKYKRVHRSDLDFVLLSEHLPNGNWILYDYEQPLHLSKEGKLPKLLSIRTTNNGQTKEYVRARFEYKDPKNRENGFDVIGSDGQRIEYRFGEKNPRYKPRRLEAVKPSHSADQTIHYTHFDNMDKRREDRLQTIARPLDRRTCFDYYIHDQETVAGKQIKMQDEVVDAKNGYRVKPDFRRGRIRTISSPAGADAQLHNTHSLIYNETYHTSVYDIEGKRTDYYNDGNHRLTRIERFSREGILQSIECFSWAREEQRVGNLIAKSLLDGNRMVVFSTAYSYDDRGNITEERFYGNLTGSGIPPALDNWNYPVNNGAEVAIKRYTYSNRAPNLLLREEFPSGLIHTYNYLPGTDLIASQLTYDRNELRSRKFWEYNDGILVREVSDDGNSTDLHQLSNVTYRKIREIIPYSNGPYTGLPETALEKYWENGHEHLLSKTLFRYDRGGKIKEREIYDADGKHCYTQVMDYDGKNRLSSETDALSRKATYDYDPLGNQTYIKDFSGRVESRIDYDHSNRPILIFKKGEDGIILNSRFSYDGLHQLRVKTDPQNHSTHFEYDSLGRCIQTELPQIYNENGELVSPIVQKRYDSAANEIARIDAMGNTTTTTYNAYGKPILVTHPDGATEKYAYNLDGSLKSYTDPNGMMTTYITDYLGRVVEKTLSSPHGHFLSQETFTYKGAKLQSKTDAEKNRTDYTYDGAGRKIGEEFGNERITFLYDSFGRINRTQKGDLIQITEYDLLNRVIEERTETAEKVVRKIEYEYDSAGNKKTVTRYAGDRACQEILKYDSQNRLIEKTDPLGHSERIYFNDFYTNGHGQKVLQKTHIDALGLEIIETFNSLQKLSKIEKRKGKTLRQEEKIYNPNGIISLQTDTVYNPDGSSRQVRTRWEYDSRDRLKTLTEADGTQNLKITTHTYIPTGQINTITKPNGVVLNYSYNDLGFHTSLISSDRTVNHTMDYNLLGHLIRIDEIQRTTDPHGRLLTESFPHYNIENQHDSSGRRIACAIPQANCLIEYGYEGPDFKKVNRSNLNKTLLYTHEYNHYDLSGNLLEEKLIGQKGIVSYRVDPLSRKTEISSPYFKQQILHFDPIGHIRQMRIHDEEIHYNYDDLYQLTSESGHFAHTYQFDSLNNRLQTDDETYRINELNQITSHMEYDQNGNPSKCGDTVYTYDALDRLTRLHTPHLTQTYTYDSLHRRLSKTTHKDGIQKTRYFLYDDQNEIGSYDENGQIQEFRILAHAPHAEIGAAIAIEISGKVYAPMHDLQGNVAVLVPLQSTESPTTYRYSAFREEKTTGHAPSPWRYSSKRTDETDLVYYGRRYYTPAFGRWLTPDPAGFSDGMNLYAFLHNDPLIHLDEYGLLRIPLSAPSCESDHAKSLAPYLTHPRVAGPLQALGGIGEASFGAGMTYITAGMAAPAGWGIMAHGLDNFFTGLKTAITGRHYNTATSQLLQKTGLSDQTSNLLDMGLSLGGSLGGATAIQSIRLTAFPKFNLPIQTIHTQSLNNLKLTRESIRTYLSNLELTNRTQIISDLESVGLKQAGKSPDNRFLEFNDRFGNTRVKIHPPDKMTLYDHLHVYNKRSNSLNRNLEVVDKRSVEAHIPYGGE